MTSAACRCDASWLGSLGLDAAVLSAMLPTARQDRTLNSRGYFACSVKLFANTWVRRLDLCKGSMLSKTWPGSSVSLLGLSTGLGFWFRVQLALIQQTRSITAITKVSCLRSGISRNIRRKLRSVNVEAARRTGQLHTCVHRKALLSNESCAHRRRQRYAHGVCHKWQLGSRHSEQKLAWFRKQPQFDDQQ